MDYPEEPMLFPGNVQVPQTAADDPRIGRLLAGDKQGSPRVVLIGFPSDEGVRRNGGRVGAAGAPDEIRQALYKLTPDAQLYDSFCRLLAHTQDLGNLSVTGDVEKDQQNLGDITGKWLDAGAIPIILGGGHETAFGHFLAYALNDVPVGIVNIDAHADVRPLKEGKAHSGSPFFQVLEHPGEHCKGYTVLGLAPWSVSRAHIKYLEKKGCIYRWASETTPAFLERFFSELVYPTMVTLDMDAVDRKSAPGVSAPATGGLPREVFFHAAYLAGRSSLVSSLDLVEMNPRFDVDGQTAAAAAVTIWYFLKGIVERGC